MFSRAAAPQLSGCLSCSVPSLPSSAAEMWTPVPPKTGWLQFLLTLPKSPLYFLDCWSFRPWACSRGAMSLWNTLPTSLASAEQSWGIAAHASEAPLLFRHPGYLCCHYTMLLVYIQLLIPCSSQACSCRAATWPVVPLPCYCFFWRCNQFAVFPWCPAGNVPSLGWVLLSWKVRHHAWR